MCTYILSSSDTFTTPVKQILSASDVIDVSSSGKISNWLGIGIDKTYEKLMADKLDDDIYEDYKRIGLDLNLFHRLKPKTWLESDIINYYFDILQQSTTEHYFFYTYLMAKLHQDGDYEYSNVSRWCKNVSVFTKKLLFIPINHKNQHWTLAVVNMERRFIVHIDSLGKKERTDIWEVLNRWLADVARDRDISIDHFSFYHYESIPTQNNSYDCGMFVLFFATMLCFDPERNLSTVSISCSSFMFQFRKYVCFNLANRNEAIVQDCLKTTWSFICKNIT